MNQLYETYGNQKGKAITFPLSTHVLFNPGDVETAEIYSKRYGETEIMLKNRSTGRSIGKHGSRSVNWSEQIHKKPLITSDEILRFPEGKCVITSPAYGNGREALFPYKLKIPVSKKDKQRAKQSEQLWNESIEAQLNFSGLLPLHLTTISSWQSLSILLSWLVIFFCVFPSLAFL